MIKKNFFIPILTIAIIGTALMIPQDAFAHNDPNDPCNSVGADTNMVVRSGGVITIAVNQGEALTSEQNLAPSAATIGILPCAFDGGTLGGPSAPGRPVALILKNSRPST